MSNSYFKFKQFTIQQGRCAMKVTTDACLFGAWVANKVKSQKKEVKTVLDIGTGTGLLSLMYIQKNPNAIIDAIEIDKEAYEQAKENIVASPWKNDVSVVNADIKTFSSGKKYDLIISNPPFYENELKSGDEKKNLAHHSSDLSLNDLLIIIKSLLADKGRCFLLLPYKRREEMERSFDHHSLFINETMLVKQSTQHGYFRVMIEGSKEKNETEIKEISIRNDHQQYTGEFVELLKDYYLYL